MRNMIIRMSVGLFALLLSLGVSAKATINYSADQAASCPPASSGSDEPSTVDDDAAAPEATPIRSGSAPIKSSRSTRPKWKALLPGTIK